MVLLVVLSLAILKTVLYLVLLLYLLGLLSNKIYWTWGWFSCILDRVFIFTINYMQLIHVRPLTGGPLCYYVCYNLIYFSTISLTFLRNCIIHERILANYVGTHFVFRIRPILHVVIVIWCHSSLHLLSSPLSLLY